MRLIVEKLGNGLATILRMDGAEYGCGYVVSRIQDTCVAVPVGAEEIGGALAISNDEQVIDMIVKSVENGDTAKVDHYVISGDCSHVAKQVAFLILSLISGVRLLDEACNH